MGIRHWIRKRLAEQQADGEDDSPPSGSIINSIFGREPPTLHALGEYDQKTYPGELQDLLRRREDVAGELREMDLTTRTARVEAIPRLQQMLRTYPHPLAYETLIHAYVDAGRWDEARGAAFAARERRTQVLRSPYSEIRAEVDRLKEWTPEEVELVRREREGTVPPVQPSRPTEFGRPAEPAVVQRSEPVVVAAPDGDSGEPASIASADMEPVSVAADAEPASVASDPEPASVASASDEPASIASINAGPAVASMEREEGTASGDTETASGTSLDAEPSMASPETATGASAERVAVLDGESAVDAESADPVGLMERDEAESEDDAESADPDEPVGQTSADGGSGGGAARRGGRGPKSQRKGKRRR